jgi:WD40 repeat protein
LQGDKQLLGACSKFACVWDTQTGREVRRFPKLNWNRCAATSPDGKTVAISENGPGIFLYDIASGKELRKMTVDNGWGASVVAWSSDGRWLAAGSGKPTIVWEAATGKEVHRLIGDDSSLVVAFAPSGKVLVSGGRETIQLWDLTKQKKLAALQGGFDGGGGGALLFAPDGKTLVGQCNEPIDVGVTRSSLRQWDATTGEKVRDLTLGSFHRVTYHPDGTVLASASINKIQLWDPTTGNEIRSFLVDAKTVSSLAFSRDGKMLAYGSEDGRIRFCDPATGKTVGPGAAAKGSEKDDRE